MLVSISSEQRESLERARRLLEGQVSGLRATGIDSSVVAIEAYIETLTALANAPNTADVDPEAKVRLQQATFLLEGIRDSLLNADFDERAEKIQDDINRLDEIIADVNSAMSARFRPPIPGEG